MIHPAIPHLKADVRILHNKDHVGRLLAINVSNQPDQALPLGAFDFGGNLMQGEFALLL
jgi:hypothetical protein